MISSVPHFIVNSTVACFILTFSSMVLVSHRQLKTVLIREHLGLLLGHIHPYVVDGIHVAAILGG